MNKKAQATTIIFLVLLSSAYNFLFREGMEMKALFDSKIPSVTAIEMPPLESSHKLFFIGDN